ncbi:hypothetical protein KAI87_01945 [Myxococcota bacterium]|nr:hypothetical protein [Myxococcota bacterium]
MAGYDDDREKKSWREIDRGRDGGQRRDDSSGGGGRGPKRESSAYRAYKSQLNKIFDGTGELPESMKETLREAGVGDEAKERREALDKILAAERSRQLNKALKEYRERFGFPQDEEVLAKFLDEDDEELVLETLQTLEKLLAEEGLKKASSFKVRLKSVKMLIDEPDVLKLADKLLKALR